MGADKTIIASCSTTTASSCHLSGREVGARRGFSVGGRSAVESPASGSNKSGSVGGEKAPHYAAAEMAQVAKTC